MNTCLNDLGLVAGIIGALLLFKFGLPADIDRKGLIHRVTSDVDHDEIRKGKLYDRWGKVGLAFLVIAFVLQLASNHVSG
ncbi:hypothetical protein ACPPVV_17660 [Rhodanobacter sp. Col0626]|uniref:hypothetical protein n=1 Tax=Rhodanobacter sp. Col0626 TaxID=3415679 RepID=UPI003CF8F3D4